MRKQKRARAQRIKRETLPLEVGRLRIDADNEVVLQYQPSHRQTVLFNGDEHTVIKRVKCPGLLFASAWYGRCFEGLRVARWTSRKPPTLASLFSETISPVYFENTLEDDGTVCLGDDADVRAVGAGSDPVSQFWFTSFEETTVSFKNNLRGLKPVTLWSWLNDDDDASASRRSAW